MKIFKLATTVPCLLALLTTGAMSVKAQDNSQPDTPNQQQIGPGSFTKRFDDKVVGVGRVTQEKPEHREQAGRSTEEKESGESEEGAAGL